MNHPVNRGHESAESGTSRPITGARAVHFDGVKVFSATKQKERDELGEVATRWLDGMRGHVEIVDHIVTQSSDNEYHCLTLTFFFRRL